MIRANQDGEPKIVMRRWRISGGAANASNFE
jgi:hypothetical protein